MPLKNYGVMIGIDKLFYHISTDEVYGSLTEKGSFSENTKGANQFTIFI